MDHNGYFLVENKQDGIYLSQVKPEGTGKAASLDELVSYLDKKKVDYTSVADLRDYYEQTSSGESVRISTNQMIGFSGWCEYSVHPSGMSAQMIVYPPSIGMGDASLEEVLADLQNMKIVYGVNKDLLKAILSSHRYFEYFIIAKGKAARDGHDAVLTYHFNTEYDGTPKLKDDGTVDFHQLDVINHIKAGDVVASIEKEDPGESGVNVLGQEVKPKKVYKQTFKFGKNLVVNEDGTQLVSQVTGHVMLEGDKVFVSDEYEVPADVDTTTGDINYEGNVHVRGAVRSGFKIIATGNVRVDGVVEAAEITAGGDVTLGRGISGQGRGIVTAGGDVIANFIENSTVYAEGKIEADSIMHSQVVAGESIEAKGRSGNIIGGSVRAGTMITAKEIGTEMGTNTSVILGSDKVKFNEVKELRELLNKQTAEREKMQQIVDMLQHKKEVEGKLDESKMKMLQDAMRNVILIGQKVAKDKATLEAKESKLHNPDDGRVRIQRSIYPGVKMEFGRDSMFIRDRNDHCQYVKKGADITMIAL